MCSRWFAPSPLLLDAMVRSPAGCSSAMLDRGGTAVPPISGLVDLGLPCVVDQGGIMNGSYSYRGALSQYWLTALN